MITKPLAAMLACAALAGCGGDRPQTMRAARTETDWRGVATDADRDRLRNWRAAWMSAVEQVRASGKAGAMTPMGALFEPDRALAAPLPPAGEYRCRTFKLGATTPGMPDYAAYPWLACRVEREGKVLSFYKETGSQRPVGLVFRDSEARAIFLGTMLLGDETAALHYGQDRTRDMAGIVERVGERRWRLMLPYPAFESTMDVIELLPAS